MLTIQKIHITKFSDIVFQSFNYVLIKAIPTYVSVRTRDA